MPDTVLLSVRIPAELASRLESLAGEVDRSKSYLTVKALEDYVAAEEEFHARLADAEADAESGRMVDHAEVSVWLRDLAKGKRRPPPQSEARRRRK